MKIFLLKALCQRIIHVQYCNSVYKVNLIRILDYKVSNFRIGPFKTTQVKVIRKRPMAVCIVAFIFN